MIAIFTVIVVLIVSITVTKIASIALTHTGLSRESAKFQARSAFTGVGFTTSESEKVVNNPARRKILLLLMILGNAGIVTGVASLIIGFVDVDTDQRAWVKIVILLGSIILLWNMANSEWFDQKMSNLVSRYLKRYTDIDVNDYASLLHLSGEYRISEIYIDKDHWLANRTIRTTQVRDEGIIILAITRDNGTYLGAPQADTKIKVGDLLILYGRAKAMAALEKRLKDKRGYVEHKKLVEEQQKVVDQEKQIEKKDS
jgi:hypothetical protein